MAFEIPHQQDKEEDDRQHENAKVMAGGIGTATWSTRCHGNLDATSATKCRPKTKLEETLLFTTFRG